MTRALRADAGPDRAIAVWLIACAVLAGAVLVVGGITRLTHSGLSIAAWQPLSGIVPPLTHEAWENVFAQYRATPEYRLVNIGMDLDAFERIYWWEYLHRLLARLAGLLFLVPLLRFAWTRRIRGRIARRLGAIFALGALQGLLGWLMVASGLVDEPRVSPLRLAAHLGLALVLIGALLWTAWTLAASKVTQRASALRAWPAVAVGAVFAMALTGALVAGTKAGLVYNTFPLMNGAVLPPDLLLLQPWYDNLVRNPATVQFVHRAMACVVIAAVAAAWWRSVRSGATPRTRAAAHAMALALALQLGLGIATLLSGVALPLAAAHQAAALLLFTASLWHAFCALAPRTAPAIQDQRQESAIAAASSTAR
jgi:heme a synthase